MILTVADVLLALAGCVDAVLSVAWWWGPLLGAAVVAWAYGALRPTGKRRRPRAAAAPDVPEPAVAGDGPDGGDG